MKLRLLALLALVATLALLPRFGPQTDTTETVGAQVDAPTNRSGEMGAPQESTQLGNARATPTKEPSVALREVPTVGSSAVDQGQPSQQGPPATVHLANAADASGAALQALTANGVKLFPSTLELAYNEKLASSLDEADVEFQKCLPETSPALSDGGVPSLTVRLVVVDHAGTGRVRDIDVPDSDFSDPTIGMCVAAVARELKFPAPLQAESSVTVEVRKPY